LIFAICPEEVDVSLLLNVFFIDVTEYLFFSQRRVLQLVNENGSLLFNLQLKIVYPKISRIKNIDKLFIYYIFRS